MYGSSAPAAFQLRNRGKFSDPLVLQRGLPVTGSLQGPCRVAFLPGQVTESAVGGDECRGLALGDGGEVALVRLVGGLQQ